MKSALPRNWIHWRRHRRDELVASGVSGSAAWTTAKAEAALRHRLSLVIGRDRAEAAELDHLGGRFVLTGIYDGLSDEQVDRVQQLRAA